MNIILSPELYWVRIFDIPVDNKKQALSVLPALYEEFIDITSVKFYVKTLSKNKYLCFAYDENMIIDAIKNSGLNLNQINKVYFCQLEFMDWLTSQNINHIEIDNVSLSLSKGIIVKIPDNMNINIDETIDIKNLFLSKESIYVSTQSRYLDDEILSIFSKIVFLFTLLLLIKIIFNYTVAEKITDEIYYVNNIENKSLSSIQLKSIIKKYERTYSDQIKTREFIEYVLNIQTVENIEMYSFVLGDKKVKIKIQNTINNKSTKNKIKKYISKKYENFTLTINSKYILLEVTR